MLKRTDIRAGRHSFAALVATVCIVASVAVAHADMRVLSSTTSHYRKGQVLNDTARLRVPSGKRVRLLFDNGKSRTVRGPFYGRLLQPRPGFSLFSLGPAAGGSARSGRTSGGVILSRPPNAPLPGGTTAGAPRGPIILQNPTIRLQRPNIGGR